MELKSASDGMPFASRIRHFFKTSERTQGGAGITSPFFIAIDTGRLHADDGAVKAGSSGRCDVAGAQREWRPKLPINQRGLARRAGAVPIGTQRFTGLMCAGHLKSLFDECTGLLSPIEIRG